MSNRTDKELLELAAKAAGLVGIHERAKKFCYTSSHGHGGSVMWNPLESDGDALRLAVNLRINLHYDEQKENINSAFFSRYVYAIANGIGEGSAELSNSDPLAATRRAIVRAAAAIGGKL